MDTKRIWAAKPFLVAYVVAIGFTVGMLVNRTPAGDRVITTLARGDGVLQVAMREDDMPETPLWLQLFRPNQPTARWLLRTALPLLSVADQSSQENRDLAVYLAGRADEPPQTLFQTILPFLRKASPEVAEKNPATPSAPPAPEPSDAPIGPPVVAAPKAPQADQPPANAGLPLIGIYHTHDWESFISEFPTMTVTTQKDLNAISSPDHKKRTVVNLGKDLAVKLQELGVATVHANGTHQNLGYDFAYEASRVTAKRILSEQPSVRILMDMHRDGTLNANTTAVVNGQKVAQIRCIIGRENEPHRQENEAFCGKLISRLEKAHKGITLPTRVQGYQYNQDLIPGAILLEMGGALNTYEEADRSVGYLAEVLAAMARDGDYPR